MRKVEELSVVVMPSPVAASVMAFEGHRLVLSAQLPAIPWHRRALPLFLRALGRWHPLPVRGVLVVDASGNSCATSLYPDWFHDFGGRGYALEIADRLPWTNR
jgi:hypothetical protein